MNLINKKICIVYTHHKLGDLIWQLPYIKAISEHHNIKVDLILREKTQAKNILKDLKHIENINYNNFRKGIYYWVDVWKLIKIYKRNNYSHVYILDKVNKPALAAKISSIKNIIGPGIGNQKKYLTTSIRLSDNDWKLNYSEQSQKLLELHNIKLNNQYPQIDVDIKRFNEDNSDLSLSLCTLDSYFLVEISSRFLEIVESNFLTASSTVILSADNLEILSLTISMALSLFLIKNLSLTDSGTLSKISWC